MCIKNCKKATLTSQYIQQQKPTASKPTSFTIMQLLNIPRGQKQTVDKLIIAIRCDRRQTDPDYRSGVAINQPPFHSRIKQTLLCCDMPCQSLIWRCLLINAFVIHIHMSDQAYATGWQTRSSHHKRSDHSSFSHSVWTHNSYVKLHKHRPHSRMLGVVDSTTAEDTTSNNATFKHKSFSHE